MVFLRKVFFSSQLGILQRPPHGHTAHSFFSFWRFQTHTRVVVLFYAILLFGRWSLYFGITCQKRQLRALFDSDLKCSAAAAATTTKAIAI